jgi:hypothetical protein
MKKPVEQKQERFFCGNVRGWREAVSTKNKIPLMKNVPICAFVEIAKELG